MCLAFRFVEICFTFSATKLSGHITLFKELDLFFVTYPLINIPALKAEKTAYGARYAFFLWLQNTNNKKNCIWHHYKLLFPPGGCCVQVKWRQFKCNGAVFYFLKWYRASKYCLQPTTDPTTGIFNICCIPKYFTQAPHLVFNTTRSFKFSQTCRKYLGGLL